MARRRRWDLFDDDRIDGEFSFAINLEPEVLFVVLDSGRSNGSSAAISSRRLNIFP